MTKTTRYSKSRQKACSQCTRAKVRCDRNPVGCSRCLQKEYSCVFTQAQASDPFHRKSKTNGTNDTRTSIGEKEISDGFATEADETAPQIELDGFNFAHDSYTPSLVKKLSLPTKLNKSNAQSYQGLSTSHDLPQKDNHGNYDAELICPINAEEISNRWLNAYIPTAAQTSKLYPSNVASFMHNMLKSYAAVIVRGHGTPPFIHPLQVTSLEQNPQLSTCLTMARMCVKPAPGAEAVVAQVLEREMTKIHAVSAFNDAKTLRSTFQAYLVYAMVLYFCLGRSSKPFLRQTMVNLQELACTSSQHGLVCSGERTGIRPNWETWIAAESQRRTLYLMYLFDNLLSIRDNLPTFLGTELRGLPAPASQALWRANTRQEWESSYNAYLVDWSADGLAVDDLWPAIDGTDNTGIKLRRERIDRWLEGVDEFGTMLYAVTCCTHGS